MLTSPTPMYYTSMAIAIAGLVTYQLVMKAAPKSVNPFFLLTAAYVIAAAACFPAAFLWRRFAAPGEPGISASHLSAAALIALAVILIEIGYLLVYRSGWSLSVAPGLAQAVTLTILFAVGLVVFKESLTVSKAAGLVLTLGGMFLLMRK